MPAGALKKGDIRCKFTQYDPLTKINGSRGAVAALCSADGRHLAMMPHLERAIFPWQCAFYPDSRRADDLTPWIDAFVNARRRSEKGRYSVQIYSI